jgi:hypothetical protein
MGNTLHVLRQESEQRMKKLNILFLIAFSFFLSGCAFLQDNEVDENRAGCSFYDGKGRYGSLTQYATGDAKGAHVYVGDNVKSKTKITCNADTQEVLINSD